MNKERYNQIIDEVYKKYIRHTVLGVNNGFDRIQGHLDNCLVEYDGYYEYFTNPSFQYGYRPHTKEEFINKIKTETEFSKKWGLMIKETYELVPHTEVFSDVTFTRPVRKYKLIVVYKDEIIEVFL